VGRSHQRCSHAPSTRPLSRPEGSLPPTSTRLAACAGTFLPQAGGQPESHSPLPPPAWRRAQGPFPRSASASGGTSRSLRSLRSLGRFDYLELSPYPVVVHHLYL